MILADDAQTHAAKLLRNFFTTALRYEAHYASQYPASWQARSLHTSDICERTAVHVMMKGSYAKARAAALQILPCNAGKRRVAAMGRLRLLQLHSLRCDLKSEMGSSRRCRPRHWRQLCGNKAAPSLCRPTSLGTWDTLDVTQIDLVALKMRQHLRALISSSLAPQAGVVMFRVMNQSRAQIFSLVNFPNKNLRTMTMTMTMTIKQQPLRDL
ncbi:MAG: hypothetical protein FJX25_02165 [Alphaproteobacteria bacterium]|nr:hypothetical protein [Alphaproteobacteria bacterium]